ncbi:MAG: glycosyl hydrolase [Candidatus Sumerlaeota bacterium]|nr:glycosyl hydrolase [Candidatus Sumerlaeota bacterium]
MRFHWTVVIALLALVAGVVGAAEDIEQGFAHPPDSARPQAWWHWMNGNVSREGVTADLEWMKRVGIGGVHAFHVANGIPSGPVAYLSDEWRAIMKYAIGEADRLGLEVCLHNCAGWSSSGGPWITPEFSMQTVVWSDTPAHGPKRLSIQLPQPKSKEDYYRDIAVLAFPTPAGERGGGEGFRIQEWKGKAGFARVNCPPLDSSEVKPDDVIARGKIVDLSARMDATGTLDWEVPAGDWTIVRFGHTSTGATNHPAPPEGQGLECDKLSAAGADLAWRNTMQKVVDDAGPLAGKTFTTVLIDSYEVGSQNWTREFPAQFLQRAGYDLTPFLPAVTGRVVDSLEVSERFLWDFRRVIADLFAQDYYGHFAELCHARGMKLAAEPYGRNGNFDDFAVAARADLPMGEFWFGRQGAWHTWSCKLASSAAHAYGRPFAGSETFTAGGASAAWIDHPYALKALGDHYYCQGDNQFIFHTSVHQPWMNVKPGMTMGHNGIQMNRNNTWAEQSKAWLAYLARCQYLLQQGRFVADLCYIASENAPNTLTLREEMQPEPPAGYDYDALGAEALDRMTVEDGQIALPSGMRYRALVLPDDPFMRPETLKKVAALVDGGAIVYGPRPVRSSSLTNHPACDTEVEEIARRLWDPANPRHVVHDEPLATALANLGISPDFEVHASDGGANIEYIHRRVGDAEVYFVSNQRQEPASVECVFRVEGRQPELWRPETGKIAAAARWRPVAEGRTAVPLDLEPAESVFVVFRKAADGADPVVKWTRDGRPATSELAAGNSLIIRRAVYGVLDGKPEQQKDVTQALRDLARNGRLSVRVDNQIAGDPAKKTPKALRVDYTWQGRSMTVIVAEKETLNIPESPALDSVAPASVAPAPDLRVANGHLTLTAWQSGTYAFETASGKHASVDVGSLPTALTLAGPWSLRFPAGWGAPEQVEWKDLISWPEHPDEGVKYFSGTATYVTEFDLPASVLGGHRVWRLDLGDVQVIAEASLNGKDLGILWKPPFAAEVTGVIRPGANRLEVRVTNLWPNRLIGDERYPDLVERKAKGKGDRGSGVVEIPQWVWDGGAMPATTERKTFATWKHYSADAPLLPSGLLGPVRLLAGATTEIPLN